MGSREKAQKAQNQKWDEIPYGDYLNAVDDVLESKYSRTSTQAELAYIAECQEALCSPGECADSVCLDEWEVRGR
jgi:hypothetical protein